MNKILRLEFELAYNHFPVRHTSHYSTGTPSIQLIIQSLILDHWRLVIFQYTFIFWFGLAGFYGISTILGYLMPNPLYTYIKYIRFGLVGFYGISTIVGYLMPNPLYTYIYIYIYIWFGLVLWHTNHCRLFNAKSSLYIYIKYTGFGLVGFYGISTILGYLMPNLLYTYILNIKDLVWLGFMAYQPF